MRVGSGKNTYGWNEDWAWNERLPAIALSNPSPYLIKVENLELRSRGGVTRN